MLEARKLMIVTTTSDLEEENYYSFEALEFSNGLILIPSSYGTDWFFSNRDSVEANGTNLVVEIVETGTIATISDSDLEDIVVYSKEYYGKNSVPNKYMELL